MKLSLAALVLLAACSHHPAPATAEGASNEGAPATFDHASRSWSVVYLGESVCAVEDDAVCPPESDQDCPVEHQTEYPCPPNIRSSMPWRIYQLDSGCWLDGQGWCPDPDDTTSGEAGAPCPAQTTKVDCP